MTDIIVQRGSGTLRGKDITDPLLTTTDACVARGRNELDEQSSGLQDVEELIPYRTGFRTGQVVKVVDALTGEIWYGKIESILHKYTKTAIETTLSIRKPTVFYT